MGAQANGPSRQFAYCLDDGLVYHSVALIVGVDEVEGDESPARPSKSRYTSTSATPGPQSYQSVYREGLDTDGLDTEGVYVGTSNGQVFASADGGDHWQRLPGTLPPVLSVTCAVS